MTNNYYSNVQQCVETARQLSIYKHEPEKLYEMLGTFDTSVFQEIRGLQIENPGPINRLRAFVAGLLLNGQLVTKEIIEQKRDEIEQELPKKAFKAYRNPFSIFFPFLIDPKQKIEKELLQDIINQIKERFSLENKTSHKIVDFFGSQNFGSDRLWFAIYNKSHRNQRTAKQLFFELNSGGIYISHYDRPENRHLKELHFTSENFDIQTVIDFFEPFVADIVEDLATPDFRFDMYKLSHGTNVIDDRQYEELRARKIAIVHSDTAPIGKSPTTQFEDFEACQIGDFFYLCRSNQQIVLLGRFLSEAEPCEINELSAEWYQRKYEIIAEAKPNNGYTGQETKWWSPNFNSTFRVIPKQKSEYQLANKELFVPFFGKPIEEFFLENEIIPSPEVKTEVEDSLNGGLFGIKDNRVTPTLEVDKLAGRFAGIIKNLDENTGQVLGVFGPWGRGKTFFIERVCDALEIDYHTHESKASAKFYFAKFHAWKYQDTKGVWAYLYEQIAESYYSHLNDPKWTKPTRSMFLWKLHGIMVRPLIKWLNEKLLLFRLNFVRHGFKDIYMFLLSSVLIILNSFFVPWLFKNYSILVLESINWVIVSLGAFSLTRLIYKLYQIGKKGRRIVQKYTERPTYNHLLGVQAEIQNELKALLRAWVRIKIKPVDKVVSEPANKPGVWKRFENIFKRSDPKDWQEMIVDPKKRLLLFVDDVDRCSEDRLIQVVDALRVLLEDEEIAKRLIVLTAVDERILRRSILWKYKDILELDTVKEKDNPDEETSTTHDLNKELLLKEYMDKLFITGLKLPKLDSDDRLKILVNYAESGNFLQPTENSNVNLPTSDNPSESGIKGPDDFEEELEEELEKEGKQTEEKLDKRDYLLTRDELQWIHEEMKQYGETTPRQIRIIMYRYMFAKSLVIEFYERSKINAVWSQFMAKEIVHKSMNPCHTLDENELEALEYNDQIIKNFTRKLLEIVVPY